MKILQKSQILVYLPLKSKTISRMQTYLTDQAGRHIDLRGEHLTIRLHHREVQKNGLPRVRSHLGEGSSRQAPTRSQPKDTSHPSPGPKDHETAAKRQGWPNYGTVPKQTKQNVQKLGGFLSMLAGLASTALPIWAKPMLPALGNGALSGLGSAVVCTAVGSELGRQVCCGNARGNNLHFKTASLPQAYGNGLYLKYGQRFYEGSDLMLGPNSPFKNVPLQGMLPYAVNKWPTLQVETINSRESHASKTVSMPRSKVTSVC